MSSTAYQTNAKPRGRRGSHGEVSEKPARSRASSSASTKLSRTLSRTLDDVYVSRNSRPTSPAVYYWYRQRPLDSKTSDQAGASSRQPTLSLKSDRSHQPQPVADTSPPPVSPTKARPHVFQDVHQFEMPEPGRRSPLGSLSRTEGHRCSRWASPARGRSAAGRLRSHLVYRIPPQL